MDSLIDCILFCIIFENIWLIQEHQQAAELWPMFGSYGPWSGTLGASPNPPGPHWITAYQKSACVLYTVLIRKWLNSREVSVNSIVRDGWYFTLGPMSYCKFWIYWVGVNTKFTIWQRKIQRSFSRWSQSFPRSPGLEV